MRAPRRRACTEATAAPPCPSAQLSGGPADVPGQGPRQVRLVEVAQPVHDVLGRRALLDQYRRLAGTVDLPDGAPSEARRRDEAPLEGAFGDIGDGAVEHRGHERVAGHDALTHHAPYERLRVVVIGDVPGGALQPDGSPRHVWDLRVTAHEPADRYVRHRGAKGEADAEERGVLGDRGRAGMGLRAQYGSPHLAFVLPEDELPVRRRDRRHPTHVVTAAAPHPLDVRQLRRPALDLQTQSDQPRSPLPEPPVCHAVRTARARARCVRDAGTPVTLLKGRSGLVVGPTLLMGRMGCRRVRKIQWPGKACGWLPALASSTWPPGPHDDSTPDEGCAPWRSLSRPCWRGRPDEPCRSNDLRQLWSRTGRW